jgi:hypothetical protein
VKTPDDDEDDDFLAEAFENCKDYEVESSRAKVAEESIKEKSRQERDAEDDRNHHASDVEMCRDLVANPGAHLPGGRSSETRSLDGRGAPTVILRNKASRMALIVKSTGQELATYSILDPYMVELTTELAALGPKKALMVHLEGKDEEIMIVFREGNA